MSVNSTRIKDQSRFSAQLRGAASFARPSLLEVRTLKYRVYTEWVERFNGGEVKHYLTLINLFDVDEWYYSQSHYINGEPTGPLYAGEGATMQEALDNLKRLR